jgi:hypothetical protein
MIGSFPFGGTPRLKRYIVASLSSSGEEYMNGRRKHHSRLISMEWKLADPNPYR